MNPAAVERPAPAPITMASEVWISSFSRSRFSCRVPVPRERLERNARTAPGVKEVLGTLGKTHRLGIISDTWPSIERQLEHIGVSPYLSFRTFSCFVGVFKPDPRIYLDALNKCGVPAEETVFIDDAVRNLDGAAALGITPILIAANPGSDAETDHLKIHDLRELIY